MAQILVNRDWVKTSGTPTNNIVYQVSAFDAFENLIVVGNTFTPSEEENFLIVKYDADGNEIWQTEYNYIGNETDYATAVTTDDAGNIYVTGAGYNTNDNSYDYLIVKLDQNGSTLWNAVYNFGEGDDIPTAIALNGSDNIYVTGTSQSINDDYDYATIKLDYNGNMVWSKRYDHNHLADVAIGLVVEDDVIVTTGGSANTGFEWDYATVIYNDDGDLLDVERISTGVAGIDQPTAITKDDNGNFYITGIATQNGTNYDIQTIKIDENYDVVWTRTYDGAGLEDRGHDIAVDVNGNVYVAGYTEKNNTKDWLIIKYDALGVEEWTYTRPPFDNGVEMKATNIAISNDNYLYVTGSSDAGGHTDFYTACYSIDGRIQWEKHYDSGNSQDDVPLSISIDSQNDVYVVGEVVSGSSEYVTVKYSDFESTANPVYVNGERSHAKNEIVIQFNPSVINTAIVDNLELQYSTVSEVITDVGLISDLAAEFKEGSGFDGWKMVKVFPRLTTQHTHSYTRSGQLIYMPKFWSTFVLKVPNDVTIDEVVKVQGLMNGDYAYNILHAEINGYMEASIGANDPHYVNGNQHGLFAPQGSGVEDADIEIEGAWDMEVGQNTIKVGVYDSGIDWRHEDFGDGTYAGSKIDGGWDFHQNVHISSMTEPDPLKYLEAPFNTTLHPRNGHGTKTAGIIGALRNNQSNGSYLGVAGIAGGDMDNNNTGVKLYAMGGMFDVTSSVIANAIIEGAMYNPNATPSGYGLDIMNLSGGSDTYSDLIFDALHFAYRSEVTFVTSRGNNNNGTAPNQTSWFPATFPDDMVLSVGASGNDGNIYDDTNPNDPDKDWKSYWGLGMDVIAPGIPSLIETSTNTGSSDYEDYFATSAAAPHVTGVGALLLSYFNDPTAIPSALTPDDIENIIEISADEFKGTNTTGYDDESGWGLLQADDALELIDKQDYKIWHFPEQGATVSTTSTMTAQDISMRIDLSNTLSGNSFGSKDMIILLMNMKLF